MSELSGNSSLTSEGSSPVLEAEAAVDSFRELSDETSGSCALDHEEGLCDGECDSSCRKDQATKDEKIFVTVRLRPFNAKEIANQDVSIWECPDDKTVVCLYSRSDRSNFPQSYVFDQVFRAETRTEEVYKRGAKDVILSALTGKNATIFAYGQTCSGKTYTMNGITENAADDIFNHIKQHDDYIFLLKFSALEIYNEVVSDLLKPDKGPLRIMDDREKGTVIQRLREEIIKDKDQLCNLLAVCGARRQVGETALNDISSRSHQIIRLMIESSPRAMTAKGPIKSLIATLNFVDLAGSERVSLTHSEGTTLKEGCYINRSLLTLSTVIRKLSDPNRSKAAHIPYRESKLTRILSNALGGNARTAIICTMSSSNKHLEQTRNTLFFASYAKDVTNRAQVNVVISDTDLIKQLKKEVALLETQLRRSSIASQNSFDAILQDKELQIQKMEDEMAKAFKQRDLAQSQLNDFQEKMEGADLARKQASNFAAEFQGPLSSIANGHSSSRTLSIETNGRNIELHDNSFNSLYRNESLQQSWNDVELQLPQIPATSASAILLDEIYKLEHLQNELAQDADRALEAVQKEVECLCLTQTDMNQEAAMNVAKLQSEINDIYESRTTGASAKGATHRKEINEFCSLKEDIQRVACKDVRKVGDADTIEKMLVDMQIKFADFGADQQNEAISNTGLCVSEVLEQPLDMQSTLSINANMQSQAEESIRSVYAYVSDMKERISKLQYQKQLLVHRVLELERNGSADEDAPISAPTSPERWKSEFHSKQKQIFELWDMCHVSIIHRSQFYLLFRGDPADAIYMEVELRRLRWMQSNHFATNSKRTPGFRGGEQVASPTTSIRVLKKERELIVKYLNTRLTAMEREEMYKQWSIPLNAKQRRAKLSYMVWTNYQDEGHIKMSAELVARLVALWNRSRPLSKEMFQLSLSPPSNNDKTWFRWSPVSNLFGIRNAWNPAHRGFV